MEVIPLMKRKETIKVSICYVSSEECTSDAIKVDDAILGQSCCFRLKIGS